MKANMPVWKLVDRYKEKHPLEPRRKYSYFDVETFDNIVC